MGWKAIKRAFTQDTFAAYVSTLQWHNWRPTKIVWHNTAAPSLAQWLKSADADRAAKLVPGITRMTNLEYFFQKWTGGPHLFIANDFIWVLNPLTTKGVHSPSFNSTSIGIEMVGDFAVEDDDTGEGLKVKNNTIFATALLCDTLGIDPTMKSILLHKEDPRTTHDCPGEHIARDKSAMVQAVIDLMPGGEHDPVAVGAIIAGERPPSPPPIIHQGVVSTNGLNVRSGPGVSNKVIASLQKGVIVKILGEAKNGSTGWLKIDPAGWVASTYITQRS